MDMTGEYRVEAPRRKVWEALNDPEILKQCIPGCEEIQKLSDTEMTAKVRARVGPVSANFGGKVTLSELDPPNGYRISGEGSGGAAGFAKGGARVQLADSDDGGTLLNYTVEAHVGGKLAQIGSRLIDATARKMADDFFHRFAEVVGGPAAPEAAPAAPSAPRPEAAPSPPAASAPAPGRLSPLVWVAGVVVVVAVLLYVFTQMGGSH
jgi:uncharacterized protein